MCGIEPTPREQALGLIQEWTEVLSVARTQPRTRAAGIIGDQ